MNFKLMSVAEQLTAYNEMVLTAVDLKIEPLPVTMKEFLNSDAGARACAELHQRIEARRKIAEGKDPATPGESDQTRAKTKAKAKPATAKKPAAQTAAESAEKEPTVAKKAKKSRFTGKRKVKKVKAAAGKRAKFAGDAKITLIKDAENPKRKGSKPYADYEKLRKFGGKSVDAYVEAGGRHKVLDSAVRRKFIEKLPTAA